MVWLDLLILEQYLGHAEIPWRHADGRVVGVERPSTQLSVYETAYMRVCTSCRRLLRPDEKAVVFSCPNCGQVEIIRCYKCRKQTVKYTCPVCGFTGP